MRKLILLSLVALLAGGSWYYYAGRKSPATDYQSVTLTRGDLTQAVTATGQLNPVINVQVGSQISGNIQKLFADFNTQIKEGQVIAQLDPAIYKAIVHQAEGQLAHAKAALELATINANRQEELVSRKIGPQSDLDNALAALHQAQATVKIQEGSVEKAKVDLDRCTIYAPIDGVVISRNVDVGQTVAASLQAPIIFTIANDLKKMQIDANVAEADIGNIAMGQKVEFSVDAFPFETFQGKVVQVRNAPITVQNVVTYDTVIAVSNDELKLKPGMTANVSIIIGQRQGVLTLPNAALRFRPPAEPRPASAPAPSPGQPRRGGKAGHGGGKGRSMERTVYVLPPGSQPGNNTQAQPVKVKLGISDGVETEILEGLQENDVVVTGTNAPPPTAPTQSGNPLGGGGRRF